MKTTKTMVLSHSDTVTMEILIFIFIIPNDHPPDIFAWPSWRNFKVTQTTVWLKCINLPKCTKFCSTCKLEVADKIFDLLTKNYLMHWQIPGLKDSISGCILESLN